MMKSRTPGDWRGFGRECAWLIFASLAGCGHIGPTPRTGQTIVCPTGEVRLLMRCNYTSDRGYSGGVGVGAGGISGEGRYEETKADQNNGEARQHALALQSMCLEYNSCLISAEEYKSAKYNFEYGKTHPDAPVSDVPPSQQIIAAEPSLARPVAEEPVATAPFRKATAPDHPHLGKWHDGPRNLSLWYICERGIAGGCNDGWSRYGDSCYKLSSERKSFDAARAACHNQGGDLVSLEVAHENHFIAQLSQKKACWIGLDEAKGTERWRWSSGKILGEKGRWTDFTNWENNEPNNHGGKDEDAAFINYWGHLGMPDPLAADHRRAPKNSAPKVGKWYDGPRDMKLWYVCERPNHGSCQQAGGSTFGGACYLLSKSIASYDQADAACRNERAHLVVIDSPAENAHVARLTKNRTVWIGLSEPPGSESWQWANGAAVGSKGRWRGYTNWEPNEPNNYGGRDEDVALMNFWGHLGRSAPWDEMKERDTGSRNPHLGKWHDASRNMKAWYVCERDNRRCDERTWKGYGDSCYAMSSGIESFDSAAAACKAQGAYLVVIRSAAENRFVENLTQGLTVWIGLSEPSGSEEWVWADGVSAGTKGEWSSYTNWDGSEPNNWGGRDEDATFMNFWGHLGRPEPPAR